MNRGLRLISGHGCRRDAKGIRGGTLGLEIQSPARDFEAKLLNEPLKAGNRGGFAKPTFQR